MRYQTYAKSGGYTLLWGQLPTDGTVTIKLLKDNDTLEILSDNACSESAQRDGLYYWSSQNIETQPASRTEYVFWMEDTDGNKSNPGKIVLGGWADEINTIARDVENIDGVAMQSNQEAMLSSLVFLMNERGGGWEIKEKQMIFYKEDNETEIMRFNLFNKNGEPAEKNVYKRERVL